MTQNFLKSKKRDLLLSFSIIPIMGSYLDTCSTSPISSSKSDKENRENQILHSDKSLQDEQPSVIFEDRGSFDITTPNVLTEYKRNNEPNICVTTDLRTKQQDDALSTQHFSGSEHVLNNTGADINVPLGNQCICIENLPPHYDNELFMESIPPDKSFVSIEPRTPLSDSYHDDDSSYDFHSESFCRESRLSCFNIRTYDSQYISDLSNSSTFDIAEEFYNDLEYFITEND